MVHRDVKPANILVQRRGAHGAAIGLVKISDFGLARLHNPNAADAFSDHPGTILTKDNTVMGTPDYLSPEQARNLHKTDIRSDLYSIGCTFYFLLTGRVPFPGGSTLDKLIRHGAEKPPSVREARPEVPPEVAAIVEKLLAKDPGERYQTPAELAAALEPFAASGPTPWAPPPPPPPAEPFDDSPATPPSGVHADVAEADVFLLSSGELSALGNTVGHDASPTPRAPASSRIIRPRPRSVPKRPSRRLLVLLGGCAMALGLAALAGALLLLAHGHFFGR